MSKGEMSGDSPIELENFLSSAPEEIQEQLTEMTDPNLSLEDFQEIASLHRGLGGRGPLIEESEYYTSEGRLVRWFVYGDGTAGIGFSISRADRAQSE